MCALPAREAADESGLGPEQAKVDGDHHHEGRHGEDAAREVGDDVAVDTRYAVLGHATLISFSALS